MTDYIEGKRPVVEALRTGMPITQILMADNLKHDSLVEDIQRKARKFDVPIKTVPRKRLDELSERGSHQGVMAATRPFQYANTREILEAARKANEDHGYALVVLLDHVTDAGNLGAIARSAEAVGASGIIIPSKRAAGVSAATYKSSAGAISHIPVAQTSNLVQAIERLKKDGFWVAGCHEKTDDVIWQSNMKGLMAVVMGSEGEGISRLVQENCDFFVKLPMQGKVSSLNVAQSFTAIAYEWLRQNY